MFALKQSFAHSCIKDDTATASLYADFMLILPVYTHNNIKLGFYAMVNIILPYRQEGIIFLSSK